MSPTFQAWEIHWSWGVERGWVRHLASCGPSFPVGWGWVMGGAMPLGLIVFSFQATTPFSPLWVVMGTSLVGTMGGIWWRRPYLYLCLSGMFIPGLLQARWPWLPCTDMRMRQRTTRHTMEWVHSYLEKGRGYCNDRYWVAADTLWIPVDTSDSGLPKDHLPPAWGIKGALSCSPGQNSYCNNSKQPWTLF